MTGELLRVAAVAVGGAVGSVARYAVGRAVGPFDPAAGWPAATFGVNVGGAFALGLAVGVLRHHPQPAWLLLAGTGFCGGFTTFSTFGLETLRLLDAGRPAAAAGYAGGSVAAGVLAAWAGLRAAG